MLDLKATTPESLCLRTDVFQSMKEPQIRGPYSLKSIRGQQNREKSDHFHPESEDIDIVWNCHPEAEMPFCDDCGLVFENIHDLQRHVKKWCPEREELVVKRPREDGGDNDESPFKKTHIEMSKKDDKTLNSKETKVFMN